MARKIELELSRRERQIMNALFRLGSGSVKEIAGAIPDPPTDTAIRTFMRILEDKGFVRRKREGRKHIYRPAVSRAGAARTAISSVLGTFFGGSLSDAVAAHLADPKTEVDRDELDRLREMIQEATQEARKDTK